MAKIVLLISMRISISPLATRCNIALDMLSTMPITALFSRTRTILRWHYQEQQCHQHNTHDRNPSTRQHKASHDGDGLRFRQGSKSDLRRAEGERQGYRSGTAVA